MTKSLDNMSPVDPRSRDSLLQTLRQLEQQLLLPEVRADSERLGELLHPEFIELGASGRRYERDEVLAEFCASPPAYSVSAQDFEVREISGHLVLLLFRTAHIEDDGTLSRHVCRSSLWQWTDGRWRLRFHQGTPADACDRHAP